MSRSAAKIRLTASAARLPDPPLDPIVPGRDALVVNRIRDGLPPEAQHWRGLAYVDRQSMRLIRLVDDLAGFEPARAPSDRIGAAFGTFYGSQRLNEEMLCALQDGGAHRVSPLRFSVDTFNSPGALAGIVNKWTGVNTTFLSCCGGMAAIAYIVAQLRRERISAGYCGAYDEITPFLEDCIGRACGGAKTSFAIGEYAVVLSLSLGEHADLPYFAGHFFCGQISARALSEKVAGFVDAQTVRLGVRRVGIVNYCDVAIDIDGAEIVSGDAYFLAGSGVLASVKAAQLVSDGVVEACLAVGGGLGSGYGAILWAK